MFLHLTRTCLVLVFALTNAQLYNDMGAAYTDQVSAYADDDAGDEAAYDNDYDNYGGDDEDLADIIFSHDKLKELYSCMCLGTSEECNIQYKQEGNTWSVSVIQRNGSFEGDSALCKYYICSHEEVNQQITCSQLGQRSEACEAGAVAQFFRFKSHACCGLTCVGLFWYSVEEQMSFVQNGSDIESCNASCLCPVDEGEETPKPIKVPSNETHIDTYIRPSRNVSKAGTSSAMTTSSSHKSTLNDLPPTGTKSNNSESDPLGRAPISDSKEDNQNILIIIVATSVAVVAIIIIIIIVGFSLRRCKRHRQLTLKTNQDNSLEASSIPAPTLRNFSPATVGNTTAQYSRLPLAAADSSTTDIHKQSPKARRVRNGINKPESTTKETPQNYFVSKNEYSSQNSNEIKDRSKSSNKNAKNRINEKPGETVGLISDGSEHENGNYKVSSDTKNPSSPRKDVNLRQPLMLGREVKESVV
ncbi:hypothetical protein BsWGS_25354 [Bradybaena similaris]